MSDIKQLYNGAFELASTGRYSEARVKLLDILQQQPNRIDALLLLGKVEYYLKRYQDSRQRFETVLTYEPGNFSAYFGLEYYNERERRLRFYIVMIVVFILFSAAAGFLYFSLRGDSREQIGALRQTVTRQSLEFKQMQQSMMETRQQWDREFLNRLDNLEEVVEGIAKGIKGLKAEISILEKEQAKILKYLKEILKHLPVMPGKNGT